MGIGGHLRVQEFSIILLAIGLQSSGFIGMSQFVFADIDNKQEKWRKKHEN